MVTGSDDTQNPIYGMAIGTQTLTDWFGRNEAVTVMTKNPTDTTVTDYAAITSQYGYVTNGNVTTSLVATLNNTVSGTNGTSTVNYGYTYDANGRITQITSASAVSGMSGTSYYTYDEAGQLVREVSGNTTEYAYDSKGNISSRKVYSNGALVSTDTFTYGADVWEDRLTSYNGNAIVYDSIGNPTSYMGATLSWRGRELVGYTKGNKQISYSYDVDGMRYKKTVTENNSVTATYDYVYSDGTLFLLTYTANGVSNTARFVYDSFGEPRGFMLNDTAVYMYIKNAQGDITGIVDENGTVLLSYSYTAWGNVTYSATSMNNMLLAATLSNVNPFTYRGYCYDYDIGMYYLQSRYYDPTICRFINADSTDYLGATGTLLSYNLFAYCENDGVNFVDRNGCARKTSEHLKTDEQGKTILKHYLTGNGKKLTKTSWANYMNNAPTCQNCSTHQKPKERTLQLLIISKILSYKNKAKYFGVTYSKTITIKAQLQNGESIIGYNYLHGVNMDVGGLKISFQLYRVKAKKKTENFRYKIIAECEWHDMIDPNLKYKTDYYKSLFANSLPFVSPKDYEICIKWTIKKEIPVYK